MKHEVEGSPQTGFRVVSESGPVTGRHKTAAEARAAAGIEETPARAPRGRKAEAKSED